MIITRLVPVLFSRSIPRLLALLGACWVWVSCLIGQVPPAGASLSDDRYDGNIFALYAGNGSLVPPSSSLAKAIAAHRVSVVVYYLDDSAVSKLFAPVVSELQRIWGNRIDLIPLVTDPLQNRPSTGPTDPVSYWNGTIPQVVVFDRDGQLVFSESGQVSVDAINSAVSTATGISLASSTGSSIAQSFNELNSEIIPTS